MTIKEEILQAIKTIVKKEIQKQSNTRVVPSAVTKIVNGKCEVSIDGNNYMVKDAVGIEPTVGMGVWVMIPESGIGQAFICGKR